MAYIELSLNHPIQDGEEIEFTASSDSSAVTGIKVTYPVDIEGTMETKTFSLRDAHNNNISATANIFSSGAYIKAVVNITDSAAYIQNADTNKYLETKFSGKANSTHTHNAASDLTGTVPLSKGGTGAATRSAALTNLGFMKSLATGSFVENYNYDAVDCDLLQQYSVYQLVLKDVSHSIIACRNGSVITGSVTAAASLSDTNPSVYAASLSIEEEYGITTLVVDWCGCYKISAKTKTQCTITEIIGIL